MGAHSARVQATTLQVADSLDFDAAALAAAPQANRWDYVLGMKAARGSGTLVAVEVHSATDGEVSVVIAKKTHSKPHLEGQLKPGVVVERWIWLASGSVRFSPNSKYRRLLAQNRIEFEGRNLKL
jgi:hypothetical protein